MKTQKKKHECPGTYAESEGEKPFNWNKFLDEAKVSDLLKNPIKYFRAHQLAGSWVTCACGNQCSIIPRDEDRAGEPVDEILRDLGLDFFESIKELDNHDKHYGAKYFNDNVREAKAILAQIESRSALLIREVILERELAEVQDQLDSQ